MITTGIVVLALLLAALVLLRGMAGWLIVSDPAAKADAIVIMMGPVPDRALKARDLYQAGMARKIFFTQEYQPGVEQLKMFDIQLETTADVFRRTLIKLGVEPGDIIVLPEISSSTQEEAMATYRHALNSGMKSLIVVTSSYHSRRTRVIFEAINRKNNHRLNIILSDNPYTNYKHPDWWTDRMSAKLMVMEYIKLLNFQLFERWKIKAFDVSESSKP